MAQLRDLPEAEEFVFDFRDSKRIEPFALLVVGSEFLKLQQDRKESRFTARNFDHCTYAGHMGFFKATNLDFGKSPGEARGSRSYVPITIYSTAEIRQLAAKEGLLVGEDLERTARTLAEVLSQDQAGDLSATLRYSILEIFRNVLEHSQSNSFAFCAQYWRQYDKVELAILDASIGIRTSLLKHHPVENDFQALKLAVSPGVSGKLAPGSTVDSCDAWANAGLGLYMTSRLCREGGDFLVASGGDALFLNGADESRLTYGRRGTALRLRLKPSKISSLRPRLSRFQSEAQAQWGIRPSNSVSARSR